MENVQKRKRGRQPGDVLDRKDGIAYVDFLKVCFPDGFRRRLSHLLSSARIPCHICCYHDFIAEAQRCLAYVHENNLKVFDSRDDEGRLVYHGGNSSKRRLVVGLLAPWLDSSRSYPFNLNLNDSRRPPGYIPPGRRRIDDHEIVIDREMPGLNPDEVDFDLVEYPENGCYSIEFKQGRRRGRRITLDDNTIIHLCQKPMSPETLKDYKAQLDEMEKNGWETVSQEIREKKENGWVEIGFGQYFMDRLAKRRLQISLAKTGSKKRRIVNTPLFPDLNAYVGLTVSGF